MEEMFFFLQKAKCHDIITQERRADTKFVLLSSVCLQDIFCW